MSTLVLGGTGKTGRRVAGLLAAQGVPVRIGSRGATPRFDWEDSGTWSGALDGMAAVYLSYQPDLAFPGATATVRAFVEQAVKHGVSRIVLLAGRGEPAAEAAEDVVKESGVEWTVVRASFFDQNFSEDLFQPAVVAGEIALPVGEAAEPFVDADDIAEVAAAALTDGRHHGRTYDLTGPRLLTFAEVAAEISAATGREIRFIPVSKADYAAALRAEGLPEDLAELFAAVTDGRNAYLGYGVQQALGRPARDFADYARAAAATGVWS
ncbi:NmrA family transcriptional regulator [Actinoplanes ianthinogenes]|uniref:NmrA family transcriptional regulator n=1 Tax=Actinoplanes ianthinogenes TaxID=122358 RepID=A0ABN6C3C5_9ACTN|nr:NAD(P)H-binding protein [Actinoplanes ianthinogenes]BCJ40027.1 NmrA family transcriptional regulator [Actinoplanes ianthinogenes]GGR09765.1 NmrA family transcriptional regulator [Actinoplanes ianthinogenes]